MTWHHSQWPTISLVNIIAIRGKLRHQRQYRVRYQVRHHVGYHTLHRVRYIYSACPALPKPPVCRTLCPGFLNSLLPHGHRVCHRELPGQSPSVAPHPDVDLKQQAHCSAVWPWICSFQWDSASVLVLDGISSIPIQAARNQQHTAISWVCFALTPERRGIFPRLRNVFPLKRKAGKKWRGAMHFNFLDGNRYVWTSSSCVPNFSFWIEF